MNEMPVDTCCEDTTTVGPFCLVAIGRDGSRAVPFYLTGVTIVCTLATWMQASFQLVLARCLEIQRTQQSTKPDRDACVV